jgi:NADH-quinone oxidoreductase subunit M
LGVILGAAYMLWLVQRLFYGPERALATSKLPQDLRLGQLAVLWPLTALMLVMGVAPMLWLPIIETGAHPPQLRTPDIFPHVLPQFASPTSMNGEGQR